MYILLNGAFGIGKTTVANALRLRLTDSMIVDPEWIGLMLQRLPGRHVSDFQNLALWRRLTVRWSRAAARLRSTVIIPMAFSEPVYLDEIRTGLEAGGQSVLHVCLTAPLNVIRERLAARGEPMTQFRWDWVHRRAAECCTAHLGPEFATHVPTAGLSPEAVADAIVSLIAGSRPTQGDHT